MQQVTTWACWLKQLCGKVSDQLLADKLTKPAAENSPAAALQHSRMQHCRMPDTERAGQGCDVCACNERWGAGGAGGGGGLCRAG